METPFEDAPNALQAERIQHVIAGATSSIPTQYYQLFDEAVGAYGTGSGHETVSFDAVDWIMERANIDSQSRYRISAMVENSNAPLDFSLWIVCMTLVALAQNGYSDLSLSSVEHLSKHQLPDIALTMATNSKSESTDPVGNGGRGGDRNIERHSGDDGSGHAGSSIKNGGDDDDSTRVSDPLQQGGSDRNGGSGARPSAIASIDRDRDIPTAAATAAAPATWANELTYDPTAKDTVRVTLVPEREGVFMFRHVVYGVEGTFQNSSFKVHRRYSNFVWLQECLMKKYPFRQLPVLPPKRLTVNGKYFSSDTYFLDRRRRGLSRFINQLVKHPVLSKDKLVHVFLTAETESQFAQWSKQLSAHIDEEFAGRVISPDFVNEWDNSVELNKWIQLVNSSSAALACISRLCSLADRMAKRQEAMAGDYERMSRSLNEFQSYLPKIYYEQVDDVPVLSEGVRAAAKYASNASALQQDEAQAHDVGLLEELKQLRGFVLSMREVFARYEKFGGDRIPELERRIEAAKQKLGKPDLRPADISKLNDAINRDTGLIQFQRNRGWLIKECITEEITLFQKTQYQISRVLRDYASDSVKYAELLNDNWTSLNNEVQDLP